MSREKRDMRELTWKEIFYCAPVYRWVSTLAVVCLALLWCAEAKAEAQVYLKDAADTLLQDGSCVSSTDGRLPVLFVHGHKPGVGSDPDPNYKINWRKPFNDLPSFEEALAQNSHLDIEPYYIHFEDQHRSIAEDADDIADAVRRILIRHDPDCVPGTGGSLNPATAIRVAIIAYSKGTISSRLFLKNVPQYGFTFNPISEFIAISPPNHGLALADIYTAASTSLRQLNNGFKQNCSSYFIPMPGTVEFIGQLNDTEPLADSADAGLGDIPAEAPGSRANGSPPAAGTLYVALFADGNRDFVGGMNSSGQCGGRVRAANLAPDAENREFSEIAPGQTDSSLVDSPVHQAAVHTPAVMCLALYAVANHGIPEDNAYRCDEENGLPVVSQRVALVHVLDVSGSMLSPACPGCSQKLEVLKRAVQLFMDLWAVTAAPEDVIGLQVFGTQVEPLEPTGPLLMPVTDDNVTALYSAVQDISSVPQNLTAMGGGLQRSVEILNDPAVINMPERHIVLFSDGMQNVNPMLNKVVDGSVPSGFYHEIVNLPGYPASNVTPTGVNLQELAGITIHTIGVGATEPFMTLLSEIAGQPEYASLTLDPDTDLAEFYTDTLIEALKGNSPQLVEYRRGILADDARVEEFTLGRGGRRLVLLLNWDQGRPLSFSVHKDGVDLSATGRMVEREFYRLYIVDLPVQAGGRTINSEGQWQMRIGGRKGETYKAAAIIDDPALDYRIELKNRVLQAGEALQFKVHLSSQGAALPIAGKVQATIQRPGDSLANLLAVAVQDIFTPGPEVEGAGAARHGLQRLLELETTRSKLAPTTHTVPLQDLGDGWYAGEFKSTEVPGPYTITMNVAGEDSRLGSFRRQQSMTALVTAARPDPAGSGLRLVQAAAAKQARGMALTVIPRDRFGNYLGPDYGDRLQLTVAGQAAQPVQDLLNGSYTVSFNVQEGADPMISIAMLDTSLFEGPMSALEEKAPSSRTIPWLLVLVVLLAIFFVFVIRSRAR